MHLCLYVTGHVRMKDVTLLLEIDGDLYLIPGTGEGQGPVLGIEIVAEGRLDPIPKIDEDQGPVPKIDEDQGPVPKIDEDQGPVPKIDEDQGPVPKIDEDQCHVPKIDEDLGPIPKIGEDLDPEINIQGLVLEIGGNPLLKIDEDLVQGRNEEGTMNAPGEADLENTGQDKAMTLITNEHSIMHSAMHSCI